MDEQAPIDPFQHAAPSLTRAGAAHSRPAAVSNLPADGALVQETLALLQQFFGLQTTGVLLPCPAIGALEAAVVNCTEPGDRVLVLSAGSGGERWREIASAYNCTVDLMQRPEGERFTREDLHGRLSNQLATGHRAVFLASTESSSRVRHDMEGIAHAVRQAGNDILLVVDATLTAALDGINFESWGIDVLAVGSPALLGPEGLSWLAISGRAWNWIRAGSRPRFLLDLRGEGERQGQGETRWPLSAHLVGGLGASLKTLLQEGALATRGGNDAPALGQLAVQLGLRPAPLEKKPSEFASSCAEAAVPRPRRDSQP